MHKIIYQNPHTTYHDAGILDYITSPYPAQIQALKKFSGGFLMTLYPHTYNHKSMSCIYNKLLTECRLC